jgi:hypothetical protein
MEYQKKFFVDEMQFEEEMKKQFADEQNDPIFKDVEDLLYEQWKDDCKIADQIKK